MMASVSLLAVLLRQQLAVVEDTMMEDGHSTEHRHRRRTPPQAWTTWNRYRFEYNESVVMEQAHAMIDSGLHKLGYDTIQLDDGWMSCDHCEMRYYGCQCTAPTPRDNVTGFIRHDRRKFPRGMAAVAADLHKLGLKMGLYVAAGSATCGGFSGSLGHEKTDANMMAQYGMDWVKLDNCHYADVPSLVSSQRAFAAAMAASSRDMVLELGSATSPRVFNPRKAGSDEYGKGEFTEDSALMPSVYGPKIAADFNLTTIWYTGPDLRNNWASTVDNLLYQTQSGPWSQRCGAYALPGDLWMGQEDFPVKTTKSDEEYKTTYGMFALLASPTLLGADMVALQHEHQALLQLLLNPEVVALQQDPGCVQASLARWQGQGQIWAKPLARVAASASYGDSGDSAERFAVGLLNLGDKPTNLTVCWTNQPHQPFPPSHPCFERMLGGPGDLNPADWQNASVRDLWQQQDLGVFASSFTVAVPAHGLALLVLRSED